MSRYQIEKEKARAEAIEWQNDVADTSHTLYEIALQTVRFEKLAKRYGLIREFRENAII
jgi:hypothetical protein